MTGPRKALLARSTPLRLTAILVAVFTASSLISFAAAYFVTRETADEALLEQTAQEFGGYRLLADQTDLMERLFGEAATIPPDSTIIYYKSDAGTLITNVPGLPMLSNNSVVVASQIPMDADRLADSYVVVRGRVGQGELTLARNREHISELWETFSIILIISLLPTLVIASGLGFWVARNARNRVEAIRSTLLELTHGRLAARVPLASGTPDDLTQIGEAVNRMAVAQDASIASLRQVSADIAHDLKTPIQRVSLLLEQLDCNGGLNDDQREIVDRARNEAVQIVKTFQSLLQIAQMEGGGVPTHFMPVDLAAVVAGIVDVYEPAAEESGHRLTLRADLSRPAMVQGERNLLGQVVANLLENSLRHTPPGSKITVTLQEARETISLIVADNGPGVPEAERQNVLRRLYRLEHSRTSEGSGLGLSLVAAICDMHGALLELSDNAPGLKVTVRFPKRAA